MNVTQFMQLDDDARSAALAAAFNDLVDMHIAEAAVLVRAFAPAAAQLVIRVKDGYGRRQDVTILAIRDSNGTVLPSGWENTGTLHDAELTLSNAANTYPRWATMPQRQFVALPTAA